MMKLLWLLLCRLCTNEQTLIALVSEQYLRIQVKWFDYFVGQDF